MADFRENMCRTFFFRGNVNYFAKNFFESVKVLLVFAKRMKMSGRSETKIFAQATFREFQSKLPIFREN
jgi:hypothetical protein